MSNSSVNSSAILDYGIHDGEIIFNTVFLTLVIIFTLIGNAIALHAFFVTSTLRRPTYYFIACLCISDIVVALISMPMWIADVMFGWAEDPHLQIMREIYVKIDLFCGTWSIMSLALISVERYICITYALHYFQIMTKNRVYMCFAFLLIYSSATLGLVKLLEHFISTLASEFFIVLAAFVVPAMIKVFSYTQIFLEARKHAAQINELKIYQQNRDLDEESSTTSGTSMRKHNHSESTGSWTSSPLLRKRQCTQDRILVLSDDEEDENMKSKKTPRINGSLIQTIEAKNSRCAIKCCYALRRNKEKVKNKIIITTSCETNGKKQNGSCKIPLIEKKQVLVRQNTNGSVNSINGQNISVIVDRLEEIAEELHSTELQGNSVECNSSRDIDAPLNNNEVGYTQNKTRIPRREEKNISRHKPSNSFDTGNSNQVNNNNKDTIEEERKRSFSCPPEPQKRTTRKSLEPKDALLTDFDGDASPSTQNRMSKMMRRFSKWSPGNSPVLFRKSFRKSNNSTATNAQNRHLQKIRRFKRELRAAKVVALIMGTFLLCWMPFMILIILNAAKVPLSMRYVMISKDLHYVNSAINPVLYVVLNKVYREAIVRVFQNLKKRLSR